MKEVIGYHIIQYSFRIIVYYTIYLITHNNNMHQRSHPNILYITYDFMNAYIL